MRNLPNLNIKKLLVTGLTLSIVLSIVTVAIAQELQRTITIINPAISQTLNPGGTAEGATAVINESNAPITFNVGVQDFIVADNNGTPNLLPPNSLNSKYSAAAWIGITPSSFTVKPGERQNLNYFIQVPSNASPCGHYAAVVYTPVAQGGQGTGATVQTQLGALFYLTVNGKCTESASVTRFFANPFQEYGPVNILTEIKNNGNVHIAPKGTITVTGLLVNETHDLTRHNIFPETVRDFQNSVGKTFMIGPYTATLLASYGFDNNLPLTASVSFWVFPWRLTLVLILIVVAVILGVMYFRKSKGSTKEEDHKESNEPKDETKEAEKKEEASK